MDLPEWFRITGFEYWLSTSSFFPLSYMFLEMSIILYFSELLESLAG